jgi:hypothetical protein
MTENPAPREYATVYCKDNITYLPHYRNAAVFVGPGYPTHTLRRWSAEELETAGAQKMEAYLWPRGLYGTVTNTDP